MLHTSHSKCRKFREILSAILMKPSGRQMWYRINEIQDTLEESISDFCIVPISADGLAPLVDGKTSARAVMTFGCQIHTGPRPGGLQLWVTTWLVCASKLNRHISNLDGFYIIEICLKLRNGPIGKVGYVQFAKLMIFNYAIGFRCSLILESLVARNESFNNVLCCF